jgi:hypothetical protein
MTRAPADRAHLDAALGYAARGILVLPLHHPAARSDQDGAPGVGARAATRRAARSVSTP